MKFEYINRCFTEIVSGYIGKGYTINATTMAGSQGELSKIDLTDGKEIIRVLVEEFSETWDYWLEVVEIVVGRAPSDTVPNTNKDFQTIWNSRLEVIERHRYYKLGENRRARTGAWYGTEAEAQAASDARFKRYRYKNTGRETTNLTHIGREIAKRIVRREFGVKRISEADIRVSKCRGTYTVGYRGKFYTLH